MTFRHQCLAVLATGLSVLVLGSWLLGQHAPNGLVFLVGSLLLALVTTQGMFVAVLVIATKRSQAAADRPS